jgi:hypothetical protein
VTFIYIYFFKLETIGHGMVEKKNNSWLEQVLGGVLKTNEFQQVEATKT